MRCSCSRAILLSFLGDCWFPAEGQWDSRVTQGALVQQNKHKGLSMTSQSHRKSLSLQQSAALLKRSQDTSRNSPYPKGSSLFNAVLPKTKLFSAPPIHCHGPRHPEVCMQPASYTHMDTTVCSERVPAGALLWPRLSPAVKIWIYHSIGTSSL